MSEKLEAEFWDIVELRGLLTFRTRYRLDVEIRALNVGDLQGTEKVVPARLTGKGPQKRGDFTPAEKVENHVHLLNDGRSAFVEHEFEIFCLNFLKILDPTFNSDGVDPCNLGTVDMNFSRRIGYGPKTLIEV
jgi:hypothetical protein